MAHIEKNKKDCINRAKMLLRNSLDVNRLQHISKKSSSCQCGCGETFGYSVTAYGKKKWETVIVGICKYCG